MIGFSILRKFSLWNGYFLPIHESFLPRNFPTIWYANKMQERKKICILRLYIIVISRGMWTVWATRMHTHRLHHPITKLHTHRCLFVSVVVVKIKPQKLILKVYCNFSRNLAPPKITSHNMVGIFMCISIYRCSYWSELVLIYDHCIMLCESQWGLPNVLAWYVNMCRYEHMNSLSDHYWLHLC